MRQLTDGRGGSNPGRADDNRRLRRQRPAKACIQGFPGADIGDAARNVAGRGDFCGDLLRRPFIIRYNFILDMHQVVPLQILHQHLGARRAVVEHNYRIPGRNLTDLDKIVRGRNQFNPDGFFRAKHTCHFLLSIHHTHVQVGVPDLFVIFECCRYDFRCPADRRRHDRLQFLRVSLICPDNQQFQRHWISLPLSLAELRENTRSSYSYH